MTAQEIIDKLKEACKPSEEDDTYYSSEEECAVSNFAYENYDKTSFGAVREVYSKGGEDKGSDWRKVFHFVDHNVFLKVSGWYASHNGTYFDDGWNCVTEVRPQEKTITVYE